MSVVILKQSYAYPFTDDESTDNVCVITSGCTLKLKEYLFENYQMTEDKFKQFLEEKIVSTIGYVVSVGAIIDVKLILEKVEEL